MADQVPDSFRDEVRHFRRTGQEENRKDAEWLSRLAILGGVGTVFGRAIGRNFYADAMDLAGRGTKFFSRLGRRADPEFNPETADMLYRYLGVADDAGGKALTLGLGGARAGSLDSIQDLAEAMRALQRPEFHTNRSELEKRFARHFQNLPRSRGDRTPNVLHYDLQPLTFGELLEHSHDWIENIGTKRFQTKTAIGSDVPLSIGVVEQALKMRWITKDTIVDGNLFTSMRNGGKVVDLRMSNPKFALERISSVFDIAGVVKSAAGFFGDNRAIGQVTPSLSRYPRVFISGDVFEARKSGLVKVAQNQMLGSVVDKRFAPARIREAAQAGRLKDIYEPTKGQGLFDRIQEQTGVGPKFHDKRGFGLPFFAGVLRNIKGIATGEAKFYAREYKPMKEQGLLGRFINPLLPEADFTGTGGRAFIEGKYSGRGSMVASELTLKERAMAYAGINPDVVVVGKSAGLNTRPGKADLYTHFGQGGIRSLDQTIGIRPPSDGPTGVNLVGQLEYTERASSYATSARAMDRLHDFGNYMVMRLNSLASSTGLGIGFRPSGNFGANLTRLAAIPAAYMAMAEGLQYADYATERVTGVSPIEAAATMYTKARVAQQEAREALGITGAAGYAEQALFPGLSVGMLGTFASVALGLKTLGKTGSFMKAAVGGGAAYAVAGGPNVAQSAEELKEIYEGEKMVPIRKARFWGLGYQPFSGGQIDHFAPSWYQKLINKPGMTNLYGSEQNYWSNVSMLPTPSNLFGLKNILDPYWVEKRNYYNRPYPVTGGMFEEVPIFGPMLADTIGSIFKPKLRMHTEQEGAAVATSNITQRGVPADVASQMGIPALPNALVDVNRPDVLRDRFEKWANVGLEPTGIWKFALQFFGVKFDDQYTMADAGNMTSKSRAFYDMNLGGMFGQTEFIRRFFMSDYSTPSNINQQVNPIPNTMPRWLPGTLSDNPDDRSYFVDFTRGDPYTKIGGGEYRLPGAGYESVNRLHSGVSGIYDEVDRLRILADVAPQSAEFFKTKAKVQKMHLSPYWSQKVADALSQREQKLDKYSFNSQDIVNAQNLNPMAQVIRRGWDTLYGFGQEIPLIGSKFMPLRDPVDHYVKFQIEGDTFANWEKPFETIVRPAIYDVTGSNPILGGLKGAALGGLLAAPMAKFMNPIAPLTQSMSANALAGGAFGVAASSVRMLSTGNISGGFLPPHIQREREVNEYFDYLQYAKYSQLASESQDNSDLYMAMQRQAEDTIAYGLAHFQHTGDPNRYINALGREDKIYFQQFSKAAVGDRDRILSYVPSHMKTVLEGIWSGERGGGPLAENPQTTARMRVAAYFANHTVPSATWAGWHPDIPMSAIKVKSINSHINGTSDTAHRFGLFPAQTREIETRYPFLEGIDDIRGRGLTSSMQDFMNLFGDFLPSGSLNRLDFGTGPDLQYSDYDIYDNRSNDVFSFFQLR